MAFRPTSAYIGAPQDRENLDDRPDCGAEYPPDHGIHQTDSVRPMYENGRQRGWTHRDSMNREEYYANDGQYVMHHSQSDVYKQNDNTTLDFHRCSPYLSSYDYYESRTRDMHGNQGRREKSPAYSTEKEMYDGKRRHEWSRHDLDTQVYRNEVRQNRDEYKNDRRSDMHRGKPEMFRQPGDRSSQHLPASRNLSPSRFEEETDRHVYEIGEQNSRSYHKDMTGYDEQPQRIPSTDFNCDFRQSPNYEYIQDVESVLSNTVFNNQSYGAFSSRQSRDLDFTDLSSVDHSPYQGYPPQGVDNPAYSTDEPDHGHSRRYTRPIRRPSRRSTRRARTRSTRRSMIRGRSFRRRYQANYDNDDDGEKSDNDSVQTLSPEALQNVRNYLATVRIKNRAQKSQTRPQAASSDEGTEGDDDTGLPSTRSQTKTKPLSERLEEIRGNNVELAKSLREHYVDFDKTLVASAVFKGWEKKKAQLAELWSQMDIWTSHFKEIEGRFGSATASYFRFTRWLMFLNLCTFLVAFLVIVMPFFASSSPSIFNATLLADSEVNVSLYLQQTARCSKTYSDTLGNLLDNEEVQDQILDFVVGTGWMEQTSMFYGYYRNSTFYTGGSSYNYNMGLAYLLTVGITFLLSFLLILVNSSHSVKEAVMDDQEQSTVYFANSVLCGWDYCIFDERTASNRKNILFQEFKADLLEQSKRLQRENLTQRQKLVLLFVRVTINIVVLCILAGALFLIYFTTSQLFELREKTDEQVLLLIIQFLPSITITILNSAIPIIFNVLVAFEDYWPAFELKITLIRTVFVRLSSLGVLTFSLYYTLLWPGDRMRRVCLEENRTDTRCCGNFRWAVDNVTDDTQQTDQSDPSSSVLCWETYVGQQFYKLALVDFFALVAVTFLVEFPRKFIYDYFKERSTLVKKFGQQEFDIPKNVLDIVYMQTLSWLGTYFAPLLPAMTLLKVFFIFYIKKLTLMKNYAPPQHVYKVSRSNSFFNIILLFSFVLVAVIIGYMIGNINPSKSCGPYRLYSVDDYVMWTALSDVISGWPSSLSRFVFFFGTTAFFVPCFIVLCLLMYYFWAVGQGYRRIDEILREQLKLEAKDRQFLLARVNDMIQHGNFQSLAVDKFDGSAF